MTQASVPDHPTLVFTHDDLDGVSCGLLAQHWFGLDDVKVTHCTNNNVNELIQKALRTFAHHDDYPPRIFITDINVNEEVAEQLAALSQTVPIHLIDHHPSAEWMNKYDFAHVDVEQNLVVPQMHVASVRRLASGTSLLMAFLSENFNDYTELDETNQEHLNRFAETVRRWDTWDWKRLGVEKPWELNTLLSSLGMSAFRQRFRQDLLLDWSATEQTLVDNQRKSVERVVGKMERSKQQTTIGGYTAYVVFAHEHLSEALNMFHEKNTDVDVVASINVMSGAFSFRTIYDHVDCSAIAKAYGGGGHVKASGAPIPEETRARMAEIALTVEAPTE